MRKICIFLFVLFTMGFWGPVHASTSEDMVVTVKLTYTGYSSDQPFTVDFHVSDINMLEGFQLDLRSDDALLFNDEPFTLNPLYDGRFEVLVNQVDSGIATFLVVLKNEEMAENKDDTWLFSVDTKAAKNILDITEVLTIRDDLDYVIYGDAMGSLKFSDANHHPLDFSLHYVIEHELPFVELIGENLIHHEVHTPFNDPGVNYDTYHTLIVEGDVDINTLGTYVIEYTVEDGLGQRSITATRTVIVQDTIPPDIVLLEGVDTIFVGDSHDDAGVVVEDNHDPNPTLTIHSEVDVSVPGRYEITYIASDSSGNETVITRVVHVVERQVDMTFSFDEAPTTLTLQDTYQGGVCYVHIGEATFRCIEVANTIEEGVPGQYRVTYQYTYQGKTYQVFRHVFVVDQSLPAMLNIPARKEEEWR